MNTETRGVSPNIQINNSMIIRGGEYFNRRIGFGFYETGLSERLHKDTTASEENTIWLPSETKRICDIIDSGKGVLIEGGLGSGKSALVYGIRATYREEGRPYTLIDGHYMNAPVAKISSVFQWAERNDAVLLWDSFDYLPSKSRKIRKGPAESHLERTRAILQKTSEYLGDGGKFVATSHTEPWLEKYGNPELLENEWGDVMKKLHRHRVIGRFEKSDEVIQFYRIAGFSDEAIRCIMSVTEQDVELAAQVLGLAHSEIPDLKRSVSSYRIAKLLALDQTGESTRTAVSQGCSDPEKRDDVILKITRFIHDSNLETKKRMGTRTLEW